MSGPNLDRAACKGMSVELFYIHESTRGRDPAITVRTAKAICATCPVISGCLRTAMTLESNYSRYGIWGGLTARERQALARRTAMQAAA